MQVSFEFKHIQEMDPVRSELSQRIFTVLKRSFETMDLTVEDVFKLLERPPEANLGDYAFPCFRFAKTMRKSPALVAETIKAAFTPEDKAPWIAELRVVGAFLNFFMNQAQLAAHLIPEVIAEHFFALPQTRAHCAQERVMIEFSQPNTHKEFHVGHARNVCLGDALCRIFGYMGFDLIAANYIGDEGTHVAKCLWQVLDEGDGAPVDEPNKAHWYGQRYVAATRKLSEASPEEKLQYEKKISSILADLEAKRGKSYSVWQKSRQECLDDFKRIYAWMKVHFDHYFFESDVSEEAQAIVDEFMAKGLFKSSEGAVGIDLSESKLGFFMARKSDGSTPYITKDLALARRKFEDFKIKHSVYVVGSEQNFHFQQLFKALEMMGFEQAKNCFHLSYAHVKVPEGKMSSRTGNVLPFAYLRDSLLKELAPYLEKYKGEWKDEDILRMADQIAVGAIKYGMLSSDPGKEIVFDITSWTAFEGNTGPYLMYSYSRTRSVLAKCAQQGFVRSFDHFDTLVHPAAHDLLRFMSDFNPTVLQACEHYKPSILANHLYNMCRAFNRFYADVSILKANTDAERGALISLVEAFSMTLRKGLFVLGIEAPERM